MKTPRGASESSTTSDNTTEFIDIVKKYDVVYNTHNPDYKNVEVKMKVWAQIAQEIGLSIDASKRKWKNLRDSYTKYLRSFRVGTKTSKKYQFWAHAEHMDFLKPYQGPGRNCISNVKEEVEENECDLGLQVVTKAVEDETKGAGSQTFDKQVTSSTSYVNGIHSTTSTTAPTATSVVPTNLSTNGIAMFATSSLNSNASGILLPMPSLPMVHLPPPPNLSTATVMSNNKALTTASSMLSMPTNTNSTTLKSAIPMPNCNAASSVGCLFLDPHQLQNMTNEGLKKDANNTNMGIPINTPSTQPRSNPPFVAKIRRLVSSPQTSAINFGHAAVPPIKMRKLINGERSTELDIAAVLQANRDLDANTLFFLSLARSVRAMPIKLQSLAKMRCMRIVSDLELELECLNGNDCHNEDPSAKYFDASSTPPQELNTNSSNTEGATEHFVYVMSPSRVENLIDISDDEMVNNGS